MKVLSHLSGGWDSVAACVKLLEEGHTVKGLFFVLNQPYLREEHAATMYVNNYLLQKYDNWQGVEVHQTPMELARANDGSPSEYIPVRNFVFAAHSANLALAQGYEAVAVGSKTIAVRPDDPYSFADCSIEFYQKVTDLVSFASEGNDAVKFIMPLVDTDNLQSLSKGEVVQLIIDSGMDIGKLWTCYRAGIDKQCGTCYHCVEAKKAFDEIGFDYTGFFKE